MNYKQFTIFSLFLIINRVNLDNKLNVEVLFESLCPDSLKFIKEQLYPAWKDISPYVNLKLVPFGKSASLEDGVSFVCQHGPLECKGNRIMSCALKRLIDPNVQVEYVHCFMDLFRKERKNENEFGQLCANAIGLNFNNDIQECYNTVEGTTLQLHAEKATARIKPRFVPTILYNGEFVQQLQDISLVNFRGVVCELIKNTFPDSCKQTTVLQL